MPALGYSLRVAGRRLGGFAIERRWLVVAMASFGMLASFGLSTSISVFMKPFEAEFGWPRADIALAYTMFSAGAAIGGVLYGGMIDRVDTRPIVVVGALVMAGSFALLAWQSDLIAIQAVFLASGVFGFACLYTPLTATVGLWFERRRGLAIGIVTAGGTLGQGLAPILMQPMIDAFGWRETCIVLGVGYLVLLVPAMMLVTKPPRSATPSRDVAREAGKRWLLPPAVSVGWIGLAATFCCASMAVPVVHLVSLLSDSGQPATVAGGLIMTVMLAASAGRVGFGLIADRLGALRSYALAVLAQTVSIYWFVELQSAAALYPLAVVFGFGYGGVMTALILCVREAVPANKAGISTAVVSLLAWGGMGLGGYQGGYCYDLTGTYTASFASAALAGVANLAVLAALALYIRRRRRTDAGVNLPDWLVPALRLCKVRC